MKRDLPAWKNMREEDEFMGESGVKEMFHYLKPKYAAFRKERGEEVEPVIGVLAKVTVADFLVLVRGLEMLRDKCPDCFSKINLDDIESFMPQMASVAVWSCLAEEGQADNLMAEIKRLNLEDDEWKKVII